MKSANRSLNKKDWIPEVADLLQRRPELEGVGLAPIVLNMLS